MLTSGHRYGCPLCRKENGLGPFTFSFESAQSRPELSANCYEVLCPPGYAPNPEIRPCFCFVIDVSIAAFSKGFTPQFLATLRATIPSLNGRIAIVLITIGRSPSFFDLMTKREYVVPDTSDPFDFFVEPTPLDLCRDSLLAIIDSLAHKSPTSPGHCLPAGVLLAERMLARTGGILVIGCVGAPTLGPHAVSPRDAAAPESSLLGLREDDTFYRSIGFRLNHAKIAYHLFSGGPADLATIAVPAGLTAGTCHSYDLPAQLPDLHSDLCATIFARYLWDASMRLRLGGPVEVLKTYGNFIIEHGGLVAFPILRADQALAFELRVRERINRPYFVVQAALLYTDDERRRILRVMTFRQAFTEDPQRLRESLDEAAAAAFFVKRVTYEVLRSGPDAGRAAIRAAAAALKGFGAFAHFAHAFYGAVIVAELPRQALDRRIEAIVWARSAPMIETLLALYPRIAALDSRVEAIPADANAFMYGRVLLFHTIGALWIWIGEEANQDYIRSAFGARPFAAEIPVIESEANEYVNEKVEECRTLSGTYLPVVFVAQGDPQDGFFARLLVDTPPAGPSLAEWHATL